MGVLENHKNGEEGNEAPRAKSSVPPLKIQPRNGNFLPKTFLWRNLLEIGGFGKSEWVWGDVGLFRGGWGSSSSFGVGLEDSLLFGVFFSEDSFLL